MISAAHQVDRVPAVLTDAWLVEFKKKSL